MAKSKSPAKTRSRLELDERRQSLLTLGKELFGRHKYEDLAIDDIARAAGISKGLLYHYFPTKRDFYVETIRAAADELLAGLESSPELRPIERLRQGLASYIRYVEQNSSAYLSLMRGGIGVDPAVADIVERVRESVIERLLAGIGMGDEAGKKPTHAQKVALHGCVGFVEGAVLEWLRARPIPVSELQKLLEQQMLFTLGTSGFVSAAAKTALGRMKTAFAAGKRNA